MSFSPSSNWPLLSINKWFLLTIELRGNDRSSDGEIIENNWANCGFEKLASSALRGRNTSMWREERWTEEKPDLNDNKQNPPRLHFSSTLEDRSAYLNNQPLHVSMSHAWRKMSTFDLCILSFSSYSPAWGLRSWSRSKKDPQAQRKCTWMVQLCWSCCI